MLQKYFLLTSHWNHHLAHNWMESFTKCRTFWYLVSEEQIGFLIKSNLPWHLNAWFWIFQKSQFWIFWLWYISVQEPPIFNSCLCPNNRKWIMGFGDKTISFLVVSEPKYSEIRHFQAKTLFFCPLGDQWCQIHKCKVFILVSQIPKCPASSKIFHPSLSLMMLSMRS